MVEIDRDAHCTLNHSMVQNAGKSKKYDRFACFVFGAGASAKSGEMGKFKF